ncbi:hypothetical protein NLI96_g1414 [Meripilus lineatus]|uniref:Metallo-beta-lactamase domain-containing protein n=1 Tax=Meripilus lineatus TaxID=2056292 RepID=A0AAD5VAN5_9APHY|nr:hypothetical protein NLI96_g1414 [Physisporinus lineatus]
MGSLDYSTPIASEPFELIFMGTGTSSSVPHVDCLTAPPGAEQCRTCLSTLYPEGKKNIRRNTSAVVRMRGPDGVRRYVLTLGLVLIPGNDVRNDLRTIVIDVGKNFQTAAVEWFPKYGLRRIDAVLITHAHADAMNGLDDLRGWTLRGAIQPHVDLYVSQATFKEVQRAFPYLVAKEFASGGGDVPEFKWHIIDDRVPFEIENTGIQITPFAVHHGRIFSTPPPYEFSPSPLSSSPSSTSASTPEPPGTPVHACHELSSDTAKPIQPYPCFGFVVQNKLVYLSDVSHIPEDVWRFLKGDEGRASVPPVFVLDCLRLQPHTSHLGLAESIGIARQMGAQRTYLTGFGHEVSHDEYVTFGEAAGGKVKSTRLTPTEKQGMPLVGHGKNVWVRPAFDGLRVFVSEKGATRDEEYDL